MDEVEPLAVPELLQIAGGTIDRKFLLQRDEAVEAEDGVIEIALAGAVLKTTVGIDSIAQERCNQVAGLTQLGGRQPGDLQHLESQTHCTSP